MLKPPMPEHLSEHLPKRKQTFDIKQAAAGFAALGDPTRLALLSKLSDGKHRSIAELTAGFDHSRQAISKHLRVLETEQLISGQRAGRETRFALRPERMGNLQDVLQTVSQQWDQTLGRLREHVETQVETDSKT